MIFKIVTQPRRICQPHHLPLNILSQPLLEWTRQHRNPILLIRRISIALDTRSIDDGLAEGHRRVRDLDFDVGVHLADVVEDRVELELAAAQDDVLT
jgi:hypothetical protein